MILAEEALKIIEDLYPINRSLTGNGVRKTLGYISNIIPINTHEIPTGTKCFDWTIPNEWNIKEAKLIGPDGSTIISTNDSNLAVVGYSRPIDEKVSLDILMEHLHSDSNNPDVIPYRTTYYKEDWGFCLPHKVKSALPCGIYRVIIEAELKPGHLTYADSIIKGKSDDEILLSTYICHPSMVNDNLSGIALQTVLLKELNKRNLNFTYRGVFAPETLGVIAYLKKNGDILKKKVKSGMVVTCVADSGKTPVYKKTRQGNSLIDRVVENIGGINIIDFSPYGSDERQYCSPAFNLPVGSLMRTLYYNSPGYHSSADNMEIISLSGLNEMIRLYLKIIDILEMIGPWKRTDGGFCEPHLGKRNLYPNIGGDPDNHLSLKKMLWVLNLSDGKHDLVNMSKITGYNVDSLMKNMRILEKNGLIERS